MTDLMHPTHARYSDKVVALTFSPDGQTLASSSFGDSITLWDTATGKFRRKLGGHCHVVTAVVVSPNGQMLASGDSYGTVRLWDVATGSICYELKGNSGFVPTIAFSLDGQILASGSQDKTVRLWDIGTGMVRKILRGHSEVVSTVAFSLDRQVLASSDPDGIVNLWEVTSGLLLDTITTGMDIFDLQVAGDGSPRHKGGEIRSHMSSQATDEVLIEGSWILHAGKKLLWIPPDYRSLQSAACRSRVALAHSSGGIKLLEFDISALSASNH